MKIADSNVMMAANRQYRQTGARSGQTDKSSSSFAGLANQFANTGSAAYYSNTKEGFTYLNYGEMGRDSLWTSGSKLAWKLGRTFGTERIDEVTQNRIVQSGNGSIQNSLLSGLLQRFMSAGMSGSPVYTGISQRMMTYYEEENTGFMAKGQATTEDGRVIDFNVDILMSRSFMEYSDVQIPALTDALTDPLMINVGADTVQISDQKFFFDLDADGIREEISMPGRGSGFLALDQNGDGVINDGSELFGTKSGDGFADLRKYDSDGNGWIDENDEVFDKLKVWCKGENGEDILMNLKEADVGAIFLGEQATEFTVEGQNGQRNGVVRSTGIFLRESGSVGTVQHVDLATSAGGTAEKDITKGTAGKASDAEEKELQEKMDAILNERERHRINRRSGADNRRARELARRKAEAKRAAAHQAEKKRMERRLAERTAEQRRIDKLFEDRTDVKTI